MNKIKKTFKISHKEAEQVNEWCLTTDPDWGSPKTIYEVNCDMGEGIFIDIYCRTPLDPEDEPCFIEAVLFDNGEEIGFSDVYDEILGEYIFEHEGNEYTVLIETATT
jgi:hypothetical protein